MNTYTFNAEIPLNASEAFIQANHQLNTRKARAVTIIAFTAFKVEGLWVVTITYK